MFRALTSFLFLTILTLNLEFCKKKKKSEFWQKSDSYEKSKNSKISFYTNPRPYESISEPAYNHSFLDICESLHEARNEFLINAESASKWHRSNNTWLLPWLQLCVCRHVEALPHRTNKLQLCEEALI